MSQDQVQLWQGLEKVCSLLETHVNSKEPFVTLDTHYTTVDDGLSYAGNLIISSGDISDVDGFLALAKYAQIPDTDVIFVMNYPAFIKSPSTAQKDELNAPGLGYTYDTVAYIAQCKESLAAFDPAIYNRIISTYTLSDEVDFKTALSDMAFNICLKVFYEQKTIFKNKGDLYFCIGGINSINPFSKTILKNELFEYSKLDIGRQKLVAPIEGFIFDTTGHSRSSFYFASYENIKLDFNGSMAWFSPIWEKILHDVSAKITGAYIMGGVYSDCPPTTMPALPGGLNRFSCATMNQLYSPTGTVKFMEFLKSHNIKTFIVSNNESGVIMPDFTLL